MDVNTISLFPEKFLKRLKNDPLLGTYFVGINTTRYCKMMSGMMTLLLGSEPIDYDTIHRLYDRHRNMKCTRADYLRFIKTFEETLHDIGIDEKNALECMKRLKEVILMLQSFKQNKTTTLIADIVDKVKDAPDLNTIRSDIIASVLELENVAVFSGPLFSHGLRRLTCDEMESFIAFSDE